MKKLIMLLMLSLITAFVFAAEKQKVCISKIDKNGKVVIGKDGNPLLNCKMMYVHKKLEVTEVPKKK